MSYPWWEFKVTFRDGREGQFQATGMTPTDAMTTLLIGIRDGDQEDFVPYFNTEVRSIEETGCLTYGIED